MYQSVDAALQDAYRFGCLRIEPQNNTAQVMAWCENKGVVGNGAVGLTQAEWHANAAMIQAKVESVLNRYELAAVEMQYSGGLKQDGIIDLTAYIEQQNTGVNLLVCDAIIAHIFTGKPKQTAIMDKYDMSKGAYWRQHKKIKGVVAALHNSAICKLECVFIEAGIMQAIDAA